MPETSNGSSDPLAPSAELLVKLGSLIVHADEAMTPGGHSFDVEAFRGLLQDPEVVAWLEAMQALALLPVKR